MFLVESFGKTDGSCRTDEAAEVATHAFRADDVWLARLVVEGGGLVSAVGAGDVAAPAAHALLAVNRHGFILLIN